MSQSPVLAVQFSDFWEGFDPKDNYFTKLLAGEYQFDLSEDPEVVFFSTFGSRHRRYKKSRKIFFSGENVRPNFYETDFSIAFDYLDTPRHIRWPLYNLYEPGPLDPVPREKFCSALVSNPKNRLRVEFLNRLNQRRRVDSGGRVANNLGFRITDKAAFIRQYRFSLAFENSSFPGYTTEKLFEAKQAGCVPIYWGNPLIDRDFNPNCFINLASFKTIDHCIERILEVDDNPDLYQAMVSEPLFRDDVLPPYADVERLRSFLVAAIAHPTRYPRIWALARGQDALNQARTRMFDRREQQRWL